MEAGQAGAETVQESAAPPRKKTTDRARAERKLAWMLCAPAVIVMLLVTGYPIAYAVYLSLQRYDLRFPDDKEFVGLSNYSDVLTSSTWWGDVWNTVVITVISVSLELVLGMAIALVMHRAIFGRGPVRAAILIPYGIITVVAAFAWKYAFDPTSGFVAGLPLISDTAQPLNTHNGSLMAIILAEVWKTTPFMALLLRAGLALVPDELHEAAKVDGASTVQRFFRITIPLMRPAILVALLFRTLDAFRIFDNIYIIQPGGALNTESVSILGYNVTINRVNVGLGSAISILSFICGIVIALAVVKGLGTRPGAQAGGARHQPRAAAGGDLDAAHEQGARALVDRDRGRRLLRADPGGVDHVDLAEDARAGRRPQVLLRHLVQELRRDLLGRHVHQRADQLDRDRVDRDRDLDRAGRHVRLRDVAAGFHRQVADPLGRARGGYVPADLDRRIAV